MPSSAPPSVSILVLLLLVAVASSFQDRISAEAKTPAGTLNFCRAYRKVCSSLLIDHVGCPFSSQSIKVCGRQKLVQDLEGVCTCGNFDTASVRIQENLVDALVKPSLPTLINASSPCSTYVSTCSLLLDKISCPAASRTSSCDGLQGLYHCSCGAFDKVPSTRLFELIIDQLASTSLAAFGAQTAPRDLCAGYSSACSSVLASVGCPAPVQTITSCSDGTPATFNGTCICAGTDLGSARLTEDLVDAIIKPNVPSLLTFNQNTTVVGAVDYCASYVSICNGVLDGIGCPTSLRQVSSCAYANALEFTNTCACGAWDAPANRLSELIIDALDNVNVIDATRRALL